MISHDWQREPGEPTVANRAECALLGAVLIGGEGALERAGDVTCFDFESRQHQVIFSALAALAEEKTPIDIITLGAQLEKAGHLLTAGGWTYLTGLMDAVPDVSSCAAYGRIVREAAALRRTKGRKWGATNG
jgi:replicative DNA helicase